MPIPNRSVQSVRPVRPLLRTGLGENWPGYWVGHVDSSHTQDTGRNRIIKRHRPDELLYKIMQY